MNEQIAHLMKTLDLSEEEAREMVAADKLIDKGKDLFPQTAEQKKASKKARATGTRTYTFANKPHKEDAEKRFLIDTLNKTLERLGIVKMTTTNPERQIDFVYNDRHFRIVLSAPRTPYEE